MWFAPDFVITRISGGRAAGKERKERKVLARATRDRAWHINGSAGSTKTEIPDPQELGADYRKAQGSRTTIACPRMHHYNRVHRRRVHDVVRRNAPVPLLKPSRAHAAPQHALTQSKGEHSLKVKAVTPSFQAFSSSMHVCLGGVPCAQQTAEGRQTSCTSSKQHKVQYTHR